MELKLICTNCDYQTTEDVTYPRCQKCDEPLSIPLVTNGKITEGNILHQTLLERYKAFFPFETLTKELSLGEGFTPLIASKKIADAVDIKKIYFKQEGQNPTWSFKDRGTVVGVQHALNLGSKKIGTVSTGNMAVSVAAYGARAGLQTYIFISSTMPEEKIKPIAIYNPILIKVSGDYSKLYFESLALGKDLGIYFINSDVPMRVEGSKTIAYEIAEQTAFDVPDYIVVPTSAGGNIRGIMKGFEEFKAVGLIQKLPIPICAQASGCAPIVTAYTEQKEIISRFEDAHTIAHAIENPYPPSGNAVLRLLSKYNGIAEMVTDNELLLAQKEMAEIGIFAQPDSAVPLAVIKKLRAANKITNDAIVACVVTGSGLKYTATLDKHTLSILECKIDNLRNFLPTIHA